MFQIRPVEIFDEPEQAPPWREEHGPPPTRRCWDYGKGPALKVRISGRWQYAPISSRADYPDGRVAYHVTIRMPTGGGGAHRAYWWPQEGLRRGYGPGGSVNARTPACGGPEAGVPVMRPGGAPIRLGGESRSPGVTRLGPTK